MMTYTPPPVWQPKESGGKFASINRPVSGPTHEAELPSGEHPYQLYSLATPNGVKVTVLLEELIEAGHDVEYDAWIVQIGEGEQFSSGFVELNPNSKIPALLDRTGPEPVRVFESGAIMLHLAGRHDAFLGPDRPEMLSWLMWQMGSAPFLGGGFGHFYAYAPEKLEYPIDRYAMEVKRQLHVLDTRLDGRRLDRGARLHHRRHGDLGLVRPALPRAALRGGGVPAGRGLRQRHGLGRADRRAPRRAPRLHGQPRLRRRREPQAARAPLQGGFRAAGGEGVSWRGVAR